ncbi:MAG: PAS domain S-box protein [Rhodospirillaceae bacterium]|jgi:PAS domain S-box-containing protein|nr:PAS domain S-box protein [Rhodospirillaceae bacterium]MBT5243622.1 PAS domain S-box protein [Rhodospirillaceae bacterium]MBT5562210.1 PAS domain S-box protein [Rhodospirillaceae bacterium]MBT6242383.1 PAS domain S-box protein [Rhodospirillaceae bacterium]MBT7138911.1 PAS domain S-box protein [Rhodospirillaceae bacterium]
MLNLSHPNKIAWKIIAAMVVFSSLITIVTTAIQLYTEYGRDISAIEMRFDQVEKSYINSVSENVWEADTGRLDLLIGGIIEFPNFIHSEIRDENGVVLAAQGIVNDENVIIREYPLSYKFRGAVHDIGVLEVTAGLSEVYGRVFDRVWLILVSNAIKTFLVAVFMYSLVYWLLTRHLDVIANATRGFDFSIKPDPVTVERGALLNQHDEIDELVDAFNNMQKKLYDSFTEVRDLNDELESRVLDRTQKLSDRIEEHKRTEKQLAESEDRLRDIAEAGSDWMWEMDAELRFTYISHTAKTHGALDLDSVIGRHRNEFFSDDDDEIRIQHMDDLQNQRPFRDFCYQMKNNEGGITHIRISGKPAFDEKGVFIGYRGIGTNITQQIEAEDRIKKANDQLRVLSSAIQQNPSMVFITDNQGNIQYVNDIFTKMTLFETDEAVGQNPRILKSAETAPYVHKEIWETITNGETWRGEIQDTRKDGTLFWANANISPIKSEDGEITHFVATHEDISVRKEAEYNLLKATRRAELANRAKTELLANMSHELRTPLNAIIGFSQAILGQLFGPLENDKYMEYAGDINESGNHLLNLINDILDMSAIEAGKVHLQEEEISFIHLAKSTVRLITPRANSGKVSLITDIDSEFPNVFVDERRMKQILLNLLSNGVKFTKPGGSVTLSARINNDGGMMMSVKDTGIGMDDKGLQTAMREFGQVDGGLNRKEEGTGLGLPLTNSLVDLHGGTFSIKSEKDEGTTVTVILPPDRVVRAS